MQRFRNAEEHDSSDQLDRVSLHMGSWYRSNCSALAQMTFRYCLQPCPYKDDSPLLVWWWVLFLFKAPERT